MKPITEDFGWTRGEYASGMAIGSLIGGFIAIGIGPLIDRYGPRWILTTAAFIVGGTVVCTSFVTSFWQFFLLQIFARSINQGVVSLAMQVIIPKWFVRKRGRAVAFGGIGNAIGNSGTPLFSQLFISWLGWRHALLILGSSVWAITLLPIWFFLRRSPEDIGLLPDGEQEKSSGKRSTGNERDSGEPEVLENSLTVRQVLRHRSLYLLLVAFTLASLVGSSLYLHIIPYLSDKGMSSGAAVMVMAVLSSSSVIGALVLGFAVERYSARYLLSVGFLLAAVSYIILLNVTTPVVALVWAVYLGVLNGGVQTLTQVIYADYYGSRSLGAIRGLNAPAQMGANSLGPLAAAVAFDYRGDYFLIFALYGILLVFSSLSIFLARPPVNVAASRSKA